jgi:hypothetical protein
MKSRHSVSRTTILSQQALEHIDPAYRSVGQVLDSKNRQPSLRYKEHVRDKCVIGPVGLIMANNLYSSRELQPTAYSSLA